MTKKTNKYILTLGSTVLFVLILHQLLLYFNVFQLDQKISLLADIALALIFVTGMILIAPALKKPGEEFVGRFMILTTVQLLEVLGLITYFTFKHVPMFKEQAFHVIIVFIILLAFQSLLLIKTIKNK